MALTQQQGFFSNPPPREASPTHASMVSCGTDIIESTISPGDTLDFGLNSMVFYHRVSPKARALPNDIATTMTSLLCDIITSETSHPMSHFGVGCFPVGQLASISELPVKAEGPPTPTRNPNGFILLYLINRPKSTTAHTAD